MVIRINDKNQNYNNVTKLLVKPTLNLCILENYKHYFIDNSLKQKRTLPL